MSALFAGAVYALGGGGQLPVNTRAMVLSLALCYGAVSLVFRQMGRRAEKCIISCRVELLGRSAEFRALEDTGNELRDPISGERVIVADREIIVGMLGTQLPEGPAEMLLALAEIPGMEGRLRLIKYSSVGCPDGLMLCVRADRVRAAEKCINTLIGISPGRLSRQGDYEAII